MNQNTVYNDSPAAQAMDFARAGFSWIHIVDLNGAIEGKPVNKDAVQDIIEAVDLPIQLGGGIRSLAQIEEWLNAGVSRVILGTIAVKQPDIMREACERFPGQIILGLDAHGSNVATEGWVESSGRDFLDMVAEYEDLGMAAIIYTDINRDGTGEGLNMDNTIQLAEYVNVPVIASGGVGSIADIRAVREAAPHGVQGVIVGKALYDGRLTAEQILTESMGQSANDA